MKSPPSQFQALEDLRRRIVACKRCPRLANYIREVARKKKAQYKDCKYWGNPLPGFGDPEAELLIIGLAPAVHGGNRTGRMFTGDKSGDWLVKALHGIEMANRETSVSRDDGLELHSAYITAVARCAPPQNRPTPKEIRNCRGYLEEEMKILSRVKVVLTLGRIAFDSYLETLKIERRRRPHFKHGALYTLEGVRPYLLASFHPSRQNTQTGRLTWEMWFSIFERVKSLLLEAESIAGAPSVQHR